MRSKTHSIFEILDKELEPFILASRIPVPREGWIQFLRTSLKMSLEQLGKKLGKTRQAVRRMEESEKAGTISLNLLREIGTAMEMRMVYCLVPYTRSFERFIEGKARNLANEIVNRSSHTLLLEDCEINDTLKEKTILKLTRRIQRELSKSIWDLNWNF